MPPDQLIKQLQDKLREIDYDFTAFSLTHFKEWVEKKINRPIKIFPWDKMPLGICGIWLSCTLNGRLTEVVFYDDTLSEPQVTQTVLHELAHIIYNHKTLLLNKAKLSYLLAHPERIDEILLELPRFRMTQPIRQQKNNPEHIARLIRQEQEAEGLGLLIYKQVLKQAQNPAMNIPNDEIGEFIRAMELD